MRRWRGLVGKEVFSWVPFLVMGSVQTNSLRYNRARTAKRLVCIKPAKRGDSIKPGVERSGTPGSLTQNTFSARGVVDSGLGTNVNHDDSTAGRSVDCEYGDHVPWGSASLHPRLYAVGRFADSDVFNGVFPGVPLRSTPGFMLSPATRGISALPLPTKWGGVGVGWAGNAHLSPNPSPLAERGKKALPPDQFVGGGVGVIDLAQRFQHAAGVNRHGSIY